MEENEQGVWEVEKVLGSRYNDEEQCMEYLLSWKGYPGEYTWEKEHDCCCDDLIKDYEKECKRVENIRRRKSAPAHSSSSQKVTRPRGRPKGAKTKSKTPVKGTRRSVRIATPSDDEVQILDDNRDEESDDQDDKDDSDSNCLEDTQNHLDESSSQPLKEARNVINKRKLKLSQIIAAVNGGEGHITLVVRWHGVEEPEKIPLVILRYDYPQEVIDFLLNHLKWIPDE